MNQNLIFWPMIVQAAMTLFLYLRMSKARIASVKSGEAKVEDFAVPSATEKGASRVFTAAIANQFELPVLFFAVCLAAHSAELVDAIMLVLAALFVVARLAHAYVHVTTNTVKMRRKLFIYSWLACAALWFWFAIRLALA